ncbi:lysophospholipid acyltransferase family protein [Thalassovita mangrovi]|uniref:1-acyl-sn-glycerol-3-phosphate acyltransferase n=1 Tax=Thalassovita mangrovi TaxID=2692236 RepID=A0A6L8LDP4_9RHOB|nr:lysophospholipid acyltransferase family protein [Thalassovita mangrovi]MYM53843.1 1-acyl-sn-glycerol-3-phosphate acyltransferase [Thalassovita mangrovi]
MPPEPIPEPIPFTGWIRVALRGVTLALLVFGGLLILLLLRLVERPIYGLHRPVTPHITQFVCRKAFRILGMEFKTHGQRMELRGAVVANHSSWLDIFTLNARKRIYFVSKSEVAGWPGIGWLARATGTVFINRDRKEAKVQQQVFEDRLLAGHKLLFFPEGTSTDGMVVLPFKSTLFQAFFSDHLRHEMHIQPVTVIYRAPEGADDRFYGWWGEMDFGGHLLKVLAAPKQGSVEVVYHEPIRVDDFPNRKTLAAHVEEVVRSGMPPERRG